MKLEAVKFILWAQDMDRAVAFWRDVFGFQTKTESPYWSELTFGDAILALHGGGTGDLNISGLALTVDDVDEACARAKEAGASVRHAPVDKPQECLRLADVVDPDGNGFSISSRLET